VRHCGLGRVVRSEADGNCYLEATLQKKMAVSVLALAVLVTLAGWWWLAAPVAEEASGPAWPGAGVRQTLPAELAESFQPESSTSSVMPVLPAASAGVEAPAVQANVEEDRARSEWYRLQIGAEGYAPHIVRALESGSAGMARHAHRQLEECERIDWVVETQHQMLASNPRFASGKMRQTMLDIVQADQQTQRRCQTVTPEVKALAVPLLLKAVHGREPEMAGHLIAQASQDLLLDPANKEVILNALIEDARRGDMSAITALGRAKTPYRLPDEAQQIYQLASAQISALVMESSSRLVPDSSGAWAMKLVAQVQQEEFQRLSRSIPSEELRRAAADLAMKAVRRNQHLQPPSDAGN
jgi:hypothetical protein